MHPILLKLSCLVLDVGCPMMHIPSMTAFLPGQLCPAGAGTKGVPRESGNQTDKPHCEA